MFLFFYFVGPPPGEVMTSLPIESSRRVSSGCTRKKNMTIEECALNEKRPAFCSYEASRLLLSNKEQKWSNRSPKNDSFAASSGVTNTRKHKGATFFFAPSSDGISRMPKRRLKVCTFVTSTKISWCTSWWVSMLNGKFADGRVQQIWRFLLTLTLEAYWMFVLLRYNTVQYGAVRYGTSQALHP